MKHDIDGLSVRELGDLIKAAERRLTAISKRRPIQRVRTELTAIAIRHGYAVEELFDVGVPTASAPKKRAMKRKKAKVAAKYRDPVDARNTWTGRGSMPRWLAEKVKRGQSATDYLIPGLARPKQKTGGVIGKKSVFKAS